jgi:hypothetical protein
MWLSGVPGEKGPDLPLDRLQPGTVIIKIHDQRGANVLAENLTPLISNLVKQRDQLCAVAGNPDWILMPDGMLQEQFIAAGGRFADMNGGIHPSIQENDGTEMWLQVLPNPKVIALKAWKRQYLLVESQWDEHAVGRALDLTLGTSVRKGVLPGIMALKAQVEEAEEYLPEASGPYQTLAERAKLLKDQMEYAAESSGEMKHHTRVLRMAVESLLTERDGDIGNIDDTLLEAEMEVQAQEKLEKHLSVGDGKR